MIVPRPSLEVYLLVLREIKFHNLSIFYFVLTIIPNVYDSATNVALVAMFFVFVFKLSFTAITFSYSGPY